MLKAHSRVGIAQVALFAPAVLLSTYLLLIRHGKLRMAWWFLFTFSSIRVGGGVTLILLGNNPSSIGLEIATIVLLGVGIIPLMLVTIGLLRIVLKKDFEDKRLFFIIIYAVRVLFLVGIALIVAGGSLESQYNNMNDVSVGHKLVKAGYILVAVILVILIGFQSYLWSHSRRLSKISLIILRGTAAAVPFLIVRISYAFLSVFDTNPKWNKLSGSIAVFFCMGLLMELLVVAFYIAVGFIILRVAYNKYEGANSTKERLGRAAGEEGSSLEAPKIDEAQIEREEVQWALWTKRENVERERD